MTDDFQTIDGVGPAREEDLYDEGYETFADLAEADNTELADAIDRLSEDRALEIVVQAQSLTDLEEAEVEENPDVDESTEEESAETESTDETITESQSFGEGGEDSEEEAEDTSSDDGPTAEQVEDYTVVLTIESDEEYDALYDCLLSYRQNLIGTNQMGAERVTTYIAKLRDSVVGDNLELIMTEDEINEFHNQLLQQRIDYQGRNLRDQLTAAKSLEVRFNDERERHLF